MLQSGVEDHSYARRIARLRGYYFDAAPELTPYLMSVAPSERLSVQGLWARPFQKFLTVAGMVAVITAVLAGSAAGVVIGLAALTCLMRVHQLAWRRGAGAPLFDDGELPR